MLHIPRTKKYETLHVDLDQTALEVLPKVRKRGITSGESFPRQENWETVAEAADLV